MALAGGIAILLAACHENDPITPADGDLDADSDGDGDADGTDDAEASGDAEPDADRDVGPPPEAGPMTQVVETAALSEERLCDVDLNGTLDNSLADLGSPASTIAAMALNSMIQGAVSAGYRIVYHFPWVDDPSAPTDPDATLLVLEGQDGDDPPNADDDFEGDEVFLAKANGLDGCGEPQFYYEEVYLLDGIAQTRPGVVPLPFGSGDLTAEGATVQTDIEPGGVSSSTILCGYALIHSLGIEPGPEEAGGLSLLEILLAGGEAFGFTGIPGFRADIDVDHDGLETFVLDDRGAIVECIDGDLSRTAGRECWRDETMADGFSLTFALEAVRAELGGRVPGWETLVEGTCDAPPEESLFDRR